MKGREHSHGRKLVINDPACPGAGGDDALELRPILHALFAKHGLHVTKVKQLEHGWQYRTYEGPIVNVFNTGKIQLQGRKVHAANNLVEELEIEIAELLHRRWLSTGSHR
jgi:hypothetical protein